MAASDFIRSLQSSPTSPTIKSLESDYVDGVGKRSFEVRAITTRRLWFVLVFVLSALYMAKELNRGWVPHDEGVFAQSAIRVLQGELPHRDFDEVYTGGLAYLDAIAFRLFGTNLSSFRYVLYLFFLAWVPATYYVASRFLPASIASAVTLLAVAWSVPNYAAAMPSWYNLFFATFGVAVLLRYIETQSAGWLFVAGLCGGISFLFKVSGLYFVAGVLFFLLFREQEASRAKTGRPSETGLYRGFLLASVLVYETLVLLLLRKVANPATFVYFWLPNLAIGAALLWSEFNSAGGRSKRFSFFLREITPFAVGVALPIIMFLGSYILTGSLAHVFMSMFVRVGLHLAYASEKPSVPHLIVGLLLNTLFVAATFLTRPRIARTVGALYILGVPVILLLAREDPRVYRTVWATIWSLVPIVVILGVALVIRRSTSNQMDARKRQQVFLILSVTAACNLIQFPFTAPTYFCYVAPLVLLSVAAVSGAVEQPPRLALIGAFCFCFLYVIFEVRPGFVYAMGKEYSANRQVAKLSLPRAGGLRVFPSEVRTYQELSAILGKYAHGEYIYAAPDCPEVYFLNGFRDPSPTLYDLGDDPAERTQRLLGAIRGHNVGVVVLNRDPQFGGPLPADLRTALEGEFPSWAEVDKFEVRWKP
jgi:hypothetical protein